MKKWNELSENCNYSAVILFLDGVLDIICLEYTYKSLYLRKILVAAKDTEIPTA